MTDTWQGKCADFWVGGAMEPGHRKASEQRWQCCRLDPKGCGTVLRMMESATAAPLLTHPPSCHRPFCRSLLTSCQGGNTARLGVHSKQVLKQRGDHT